MLPLSLALGVAPFFPEPHIVEKCRMLMAGTLRRPLDIFDLVLHASALSYFGYRAGRELGSLLLKRREGR
ncbi:hypothetical protein GPICK_04135 [Geobacter pickeringii]|uniref:Uncharacterized protein n=2 Tax=Geobacter pickeringii TaxID=345632 RepID=A0A0B5BL73_9BACT|nr:hypothetical protein GPICK_04135 [Geobacter pickeringii]